MNWISSNNCLKVPQDFGCRGWCSIIVLLKKRLYGLVSCLDFGRVEHSARLSSPHRVPTKSPRASKGVHGAHASAGMATRKEWLGCEALEITHGPRDMMDRSESSDYLSLEFPAKMGKLAEFWLVSLSSFVWFMSPVFRCHAIPGSCKAFCLRQWSSSSREPACLDVGGGS